MNFNEQSSVDKIAKLIVENGDAGGLYFLKSVLHVRHGEIAAGMNCLRVAVNGQLIVDGPVLKLTREKQDAFIKESQEQKLDSQLGALLVIRAVALLVSKDAHAALADLDLAVAKFPRLPEAYNTRGICESVLGDKKKALEDYDTAIGLNPNYVDAINNRAGLRKRLGDEEGASQDRIRVVTLINRVMGMGAGEPKEEPFPQRKEGEGTK